MEKVQGNILVRFSVASFLVMATLLAVLTIVLFYQIRTDSLDALVDDPVVTYENPVVQPLVSTTLLTSI